MNQRVRLAGEIQKTRELLDRKPAVLGLRRCRPGSREFDRLNRIREDVLELALENLAVG